jgi:hypothetical protein
MNSASAIPFEKNPGESAGAKVGTTQGHARTAQQWVTGMGDQSTIARTTLAREQRGTILRGRAWKSASLKAQNTSSLRSLTTQEITKEVQGIVLQFPTVEVVEDTQASLRAIENIRNGDSGMSLKTFVNLCRANPRARALASAMLGFGAESDPEVVQAISVLMNQLVREGIEQSARDAGEACDTAMVDMFGGTNG